MSAQDIANAAIGAGFSGSGLVTAIAVALAESGGDPNAHNQGTSANPEDSRGLWQININAHPSYAGVNLYDPATNAQAAFAISNGGSNWGAWSTFTNGAYLVNLPTAQAAAGGTASGDGSSFSGPSPSLPSLPSLFAGSVTIGSKTVPKWALWAGGALVALLVLD